MSSASNTPYTASPWLAFVLRLTSVSFILFFGGAILLVLLRLDVTLMQSEIGRLFMRLVRWGDQNGGGEHYELMISTIYVVWGCFIWKAAANPLEQKLFLDFTVLANMAHFSLMFMQGLLMHGEHIHLVGDVMLGWASLVLLMIVWLPARAHAK